MTINVYFLLGFCWYYEYGLHFLQQIGRWTRSQHGDDTISRSDFFNPNDWWVHLPWQKGHQESPKNQSNLKSRQWFSLQLQVWKFLRDRVYHFSLSNGENPSEVCSNFQGLCFLGSLSFFNYWEWWSIILMLQKMIENLNPQRYTKSIFPSGHFFSAASMVVFRHPCQIPLGPHLPNEAPKQNKPPGW